MRSALVALLLVGCVDARDVFAPYRPDPREVEALLDRPRQAHYDAALVLGCPAQADGAPSLCERCRVKSAVRLYRRGVVGTLVFSGGAAHSQYIEADVMADLAMKRGVPGAAILREGRALTTWQNVRYAKYLLEDNHLATTLVVSTADHLPRARRIAQFYGLSDERTGYFACDRDPPADSDEEWRPQTVVVPREED